MLAVEISRVKQKNKCLIGIFLVILLSVFPFHLMAKADYAQSSSGTLNLSAEFGASWVKDDIPYSSVTMNAVNTTFIAGSTASFGAGGTDV